VLPTIGHFVQLEAPEAVNQALADFLNSHADSSA
jgi:pimeloyl-ACP methyl ester carboxylesterase